MNKNSLIKVGKNIKKERFVSSTGNKSWSNDVVSRNKHYNDYVRNRHNISGTISTNYKTGEKKPGIHLSNVGKHDYISQDKEYDESFKRNFFDELVEEYQINDEKARENLFNCTQYINDFLGKSEYSYASYKTKQKLIKGLYETFFNLTENIKKDNE